MQGGWPDFRALAFNVNSTTDLFSQSATARTGSSGGSNANPGSSSQSSLVSSSGAGPVSFSEVTSLSTPSFKHIPGKSALGSGLAAVLHAAGGFLRLLRHRGPDKRSKKGQGKKERADRPHDLQLVKHATGAVGHDGSIVSIRFNQGSTSFLLSRVASLFRGSWGKLKNHGALPAMLTAILPPLETSSLAIIPGCGQHAFGSAVMEGELSGPLVCSSQAMIVEPKTGVHFPMHLSCIDIDNQAGDVNPSCQVLAGVGFRSKEVIKFKSIKIYAFGLYVQPDHLRAQLGDKYKGVSFEELKDRPDFFDDLLRKHEVDMTVRLVVHYKGLKMGMVRNAFLDSLGNRLKKIEGGAGDDGLQTFCSYLSDDIRLHQGSTIDIRWQPGGRLRTEIGGRQVGVIYSPPLCQAFFDLYIGDPPVSKAAKQTIGANFARILQERSSSN